MALELQSKQYNRDHFTHAELKKGKQRNKVKQSHRFPLLLIIILNVVNTPWAVGHTYDTPSIADTLTAIKHRFSLTMEAKALIELTPELVLDALTPEEKAALTTEYLHFTVNQPVTLYLIKSAAMINEPFWLYNHPIDDNRNNKNRYNNAIKNKKKGENAFKKLPTTVHESNQTFEVWERSFPAGVIKLGINSFKRNFPHYAIALKQHPSSSTPLAISNAYPKSLQLTQWEIGARPFTDNTHRLQTHPELFQNSYLLQLPFRRAKLSQLIGLFRHTLYPASDKPDQIKLTWCGEPKTEICIQWRTQAHLQSANQIEGMIQYRPKTTQAAARNALPMRWQSQKSTSALLHDEHLLNDTTNKLYTAHLTDLLPNTTYEYRVGNSKQEAPSKNDSKNHSKYHWSSIYTFKTAPKTAASFRFHYMGDAQNGLTQWGDLIQKSFQRHSDTRFYIMAGDLVERGGERDDWDHFFQVSTPIFAQKPIVPALGNHEYPKGEPTLYLNYFTLPNNGPKALPRGKAYFFNYGNALFITLDSNISPKAQTAWLANLLQQQHQQKQPPKWQFVIFHHPAYSAVPSRDNLAIREEWVPLFDQYQVDFVLQGHDHSYMRSYPLKAGQKVGQKLAKQSNIAEDKNGDSIHNQQDHRKSGYSKESDINEKHEGSYYVVSVSGNKHYPQVERSMTAKGFVNIPTYQILDIQLKENRLHYRAFSRQAELLDEVIVTKP